MPKLPFEVGIGHYDEPPPDSLQPGDLDELRDADRFREANELRAWIEVEDGGIVGHGYSGRGLVGATTFRLGPKKLVVPVCVRRPQSNPEQTGDSVRFVQTVGGRAGFPAPRRVKNKPILRIHSATCWTTLELTIDADGTSHHELIAPARSRGTGSMTRLEPRPQDRRRRFQDVVSRGSRRAHALGRRGVGDT